MKVSRLADTLEPSGIRAFFDLVIGMRDVISLGVGEPDFPTPWNIREIGLQTLREGLTSYTSNKGLQELIDEIARYTKRRYGVSYQPESEILVTVGTSEAFDLTIRAIIEPGDEVLVPEPHFVCYKPLVRLTHGTPVSIPTYKTGFKVRPRDLERLCTPRTKAIILNYPNNPTGVTYTKAELKKLLRVIERKNLLVISDEIYGELSYDFPHTSFASLPGAKKRTIYINGFSKAFAMTGWRIGYVCGPAPFIAAMNKIHQYAIMCAPTIAQFAAIEALRNSERDVEDMKTEYDRRRLFVVDTLKKMGFELVVPQGAFYVYPRLPKRVRLRSGEFAEQLLEKKKVAVVPGTAFGPSCERFIRISYSTSMANLEEAMIRIKSFLKTI